MREEFPYSIFKNIPTVETNRLIMRKIIPADTADMFNYASLESVTRFLTWYPHPTLKYTKQYIKEIGKCYSNGTFYDWGLISKDSGHFIGTCGYTSFDKLNNTAEVGYVLAPEYWGKGLAAEALNKAIEFAFEMLDIERIEAKHMIGNDNSAAVMKKCGMKFEGIARHSMLIKNDYRDIAIYSIIKEDYHPAGVANC